MEKYGSEWVLTFLMTVWTHPLGFLVSAPPTYSPLLSLTDDSPPSNTRDDSILNAYYNERKQRDERKSYPH